METFSKPRVYIGNVNTLQLKKTKTVLIKFTLNVYSSVFFLSMGVMCQCRVTFMTNPSNRFSSSSFLCDNKPILIFCRRSMLIIINCYYSSIAIVNVSVIFTITTVNSLSPLLNIVEVTLLSLSVLFAILNLWCILFVNLW